MTTEYLYGGRVETMIHLETLVKQSNASMPAFSAVSADDLLPIERPQRPIDVPLLLQADQVLDTVNERWTDIHERLADLLSPMLSELQSDLGLPVLKTSYVANSEFGHLSFAGVGATVYTRARDPTALVQALIKLLRLRYKGYAIYYHKAHPSASSLDVGILGMEFMQKQTVWGTVWGSPAGLVVECSREDRDPVRLATFMVCDKSWWSRLPEWLQEVKGLAAVIDLMTVWSQSGIAGRHFDVEFCINRDGQFHLTQWRPIPERTSVLLDATIGRGQDALGLTPFSDTMSFSGRLRLAQHFPITISELVHRIAESQNEIWAVPYTQQNQNISLFQLLVAAHRHPGLRLPPLLILNERAGRIGHLHAITPEDSRVSTAVHIPAQAILPWHEGDAICLHYVQGVPQLAENPKMFAL